MHKEVIKWRSCFKYMFNEVHYLFFFTLSHLLILIIIFVLNNFYYKKKKYKWNKVKLNNTRVVHFLYNTISHVTKPSAIYEVQYQLSKLDA